MPSLSLLARSPRAAPRDGQCPTYGSFGERKLSLLCQGLGLSHRLTLEGLEAFRLLSQSWSKRPLGPAPAWQNDITDDGTPFEFSIAFDGGAPRLRMLVEAQDDPLTLLSSWAAGLTLNQRLRCLPTVDLARFDRVSDLFAPVDGVPARCALWHAAVIDPDPGTMYKVYLNPQVRGRQRAIETVTEALARLHMERASDFLLSRLTSSRTQLAYLSLDISAAPGARVKIYLGHPGIAAEEIEPQLEGVHNYVSGDGKRWIRQLTGTNGPFDHRPILTCLSFTADDEHPTATLHIPIRDYTCHDGHSVERTCKLLSSRDSRAFRSALNRFACRPLETARSLVTYVSLRRTRSGHNVTTYLAPEAFAVTPSRPLSTP
jgi:DMATS type aromatic prenyltransferase